MLKASDEVVSEPELVEFYASIAIQTRFKEKAAIVEPENPRTITAKEIVLKLSVFMDEMNEFRHETQW